MSDTPAAPHPTPVPTTIAEKKLRPSSRRLSQRLLRRTMHRGQSPVTTLDQPNVDGVMTRVLEQCQSAPNPHANARTCAVHVEEASDSAACAVRTGSPAGVSNDSQSLLDQPLNELRIQVAFMAGLCADGVKGVQLRSPESWAGEFLDLIRENDTPQRYFAEAQTSPYAADGAACQALVQLAAAYAWKLHHQGQGYTVPGSLRHSLSHLGQADREAFARRTADYQTHSYAVEGQRLSQPDLQSDLKALFQRS